ncbi:hypothetical protein FOMPIDRAFT_93939 [Fomitopsis schrenkii]|uniref:Uncharacterized protein n=1 Tax=Fomitopsis schrenkii TaxID=2126942 RepID=S8DL20_FOMSC|nr:hypothetical protein FOMPIDRAFT_93939 [Fomitopsis schrenkii]
MAGYARAATPPSKRTTNQAASEEEPPRAPPPEAPATHPPIFSRQRPRTPPRPATRKANTPPKATKLEQDEPTTPCPAPRLSFASFKRKRVESTSDELDDRRGTVSITANPPAPIHAPTARRWAARQATPGPSNGARHTHLGTGGILPGFVRPSLDMFSDYPPPFTQANPGDFESSLLHSPSRSPDHLLTGDDLDNPLTALHPVAEWTENTTPEQAWDTAPAHCEPHTPTMMSRDSDTPADTTEYQPPALPHAGEDLCYDAVDADALWTAWARSSPPAPGPAQFGDNTYVVTDCRSPPTRLPSGATALLGATPAPAPRQTALHQTRPTRGAPPPLLQQPLPSTWRAPPPPPPSFHPHLRAMQTGDRDAPILIDFEDEDRATRMDVDEQLINHDPYPGQAGPFAPTLMPFPPYQHNAHRPDTPYAHHHPGAYHAQPQLYHRTGDAVHRTASEAGSSTARSQAMHCLPTTNPFPVQIHTATLTPAPWPAVHGDHPEWEFDNLEPSMRDYWRQLDPRTPACLVMEAGYGAADEHAEARRNRQIAAFKSAYGCKVRVVQAQPLTRTARNGPPLFSLAIADTTRDAAGIAAAIASKWTSVRDGSTMYCLPLKTSLPSLVAIYTRVEAFGVTGDDAITRHICRHLESPEKRERILTFIKSDQARTKHTGLVNPELTLARLVSSVRAVSSTRTRAGTSTKLIAVHLEAPVAAGDGKAWLAFRDLFQALRFGTGLTGFPILYTDPMHCATCHGVDHDTAMCKLPNSAGWYGPGGEQPQTGATMAGAPPMRGRPSGRGGLAAGRGRR